MKHWKNLLVCLLAGVLALGVLTACSGLGSVNTGTDAEKAAELAQQLGLEPFDLGRLLGDDPGAALLHPAQLAGQDPMLAGQTNDMGNVGPQRRPGLLLQPVHGAQTRSSVHRARLAAMAETLRWAAAMQAFLGPIQHLGQGGEGFHLQPHGDAVERQMHHGAIRADGHMTERAARQQGMLAAG